MLDVPSRFYKFDRQVIEELRVCRSIAHDAEILSSPHQPGSEERLPKAIDGHPGCQGMVWVHQPVSESQAVRGSSSRQGRQHCWDCRLDLGQGPGVITTLEDLGTRGGGAFLHDQCGGRTRIDEIATGFRLRDSACCGLKGGIYHVVEMLVESFAVSRGELFPGSGAGKALA